MAALPTGTVTFLFTDIEGSTALLQRLGDRRYAEVLAEHQRLLRDAFATGHGQEIDTQGDAFLVAFSRARDALATAVTAQMALTKHAWPDDASFKVRMGLHTGEPISGTGDYVGLDVHRAARICAAGHGGQILVSLAVAVLVAPELPPGASLRDLGTHRLKDLKKPERLLQVVHPDLQADFPSLKVLDARPNNLPIQLTSFVGREREIAAVRDSLSAARLVTLTGAGGCGKTRLALRVATDVLDNYPDGVWFTQLAPLSEPALVPKALASAMGIPEQPGRSLTDTLLDHLRRRGPLLLLDNCEHLLEASAHLADALLRACPNLHIVATSREALGIAGELTYRVPSLSLPDPRRVPSLEALTQYEAVRLFVERAAFSKPGFHITNGNAAAVAQVTYRLDGMPLAIELAAARVKALPVDVIAARLDDQFRLLTGGSRTGLPRQQTLRATLDWSYNLLSEPERILLRRLSVFAGGFTLEAVEQICTDDSVDARDVMDLLTRLVDKSLVIFDERERHARYALLESVRQYGREKLEQAEESDEFGTRHRAWYLALAERAEVRMRGPEQTMWLDRLEMEHDNLRAALRWITTEEDDTEIRLRLAGALGWLWNDHTHWAEGRMCLENVLVGSRAIRSTARVKALHRAGLMAWRQGDNERAMALHENSLALARELGDQGGIAHALFGRASVTMRQGDLEAAKALFEESLVAFQNLDDKWSMATTLANLGVVARRKGDFAKSVVLCEESLAIRRTLGGKTSIAQSLRLTGHAVRLQGDLERATGLYRESLALFGETGEKWYATECIEGLALIACARGNHERAARLLGTAEAARETFGITMPRPEAGDQERFWTTIRERPEGTAFAPAWAEGRAMTLEQAVEYALALQG